jgi:metallo-beta-lactamase class B VIM
LIDGAWGELATLSLLEKVKKETGKAVTKMIVTHHHIDRTAGVDVAEWRGIQIFTHPDTPNLAAKAGFPVPNTSVAALKTPGSRTKVGNVELAYPGQGHAQDNLVAYIPSADILYGGCAVRGAGSKTLGNQEDANLEKWAVSLNWMKSTYPKAKVVVPGHGKGANLSLIDATLALISNESGAKDAAP